MEHGKKHFKKKRQDGRPQFKPRPKKTDLELAEIEKLTGKYSKVNSKEVKSFRDLPLSSNTQKGLAESGFSEPTEIQRESISLALRGLDVLGAAKTGSGKTLAFIIPLLERLFTLRWSRIDGLGAIVITPTRELAYQVLGANIIYSVQDEPFLLFPRQFTIFVSSYSFHSTWYPHPQVWGAYRRYGVHKGGPECLWSLRVHFAENFLK